MDNGIGIYIHVPFCKSKCYYCDFNSYSGMDYLAGSYFNALKTEMRSKSEDLKDCTVKTVFIGGGTPSLIDPAYVSGLLEECRRLFNIAPDAEVSMECNPGTLSFESLRVYRQAGVNRLSIGLQAWQDRLLESLGRIHRRQQFVENLEAAYRAGFTNINADLIFGLPGQTFEDWAETLEAVTALHREHRLTHLSCYSLQIEEGTVFGDRYESGTLTPAEDELDRKMYRHAVEFLAKMGYKHYELSNFSLPGFECRHNLIYWKAEEYAGFGAGAHSYLKGKRFGNIAGIEDYIAAVKRLEKGLETGPDHDPISVGADAGLHEDVQHTGREESISEFMILGLRLVKGVSSREFRQRYGEDLQKVFGSKLEKLVKAGLLIREEFGNTVDLPREYRAESAEVCYRLSDTGLDLANKVFVEFI